MMPTINIYVMLYVIVLYVQQQCFSGKIYLLSTGIEPGPTGLVSGMLRGLGSNSVRATLKVRKMLPEIF